MVCVTSEKVQPLWICGDLHFPLLVFIPTSKSQTFKLPVSILGFVCVGLWHSAYKAIERHAKNTGKYTVFLVTRIKQPHSLSSVGTHRTWNSVIFFFLWLLLPCANTAPTETSNQTSLKMFSFNTTFIRTWKKMNEAWNVTIKFHACVVQKTM